MRRIIYFPLVQLVRPQSSEIFSNSTLFLRVYFPSVPVNLSGPNLGPVLWPSLWAVTPVSLPRGQFAKASSQLASLDGPTLCRTLLFPAGLRLRVIQPTAKFWLASFSLMIPSAVRRSPRTSVGESFLRLCDTAPILDTLHSYSLAVCRGFF